MTVCDKCGKEIKNDMYSILRFPKCEITIVNLVGGKKVELCSRCQMKVIDFVNNLEKEIEV